MNYIAISSNNIKGDEDLMKMNHDAIGMMQKFLQAILNQQHYFLNYIINIRNQASLQGATSNGSENDSAKSGPESNQN